MGDWEAELNTRSWTLGAFLVVVAVVSVSAVWWHITAERAMEIDRLPGTYASEGVWGSSTLVMRNDHTFTQSAHFKNEISGKDEGSQSVEGKWECIRHTDSENELAFRPFIQLDPVDKHEVRKGFDTTYEMMISAPAMNVSPGAGIYYRKK